MDAQPIAVHALDQDRCAAQQLLQPCRSAFIGEQDDAQLRMDHLEQRDAREEVGLPLREA